MSVVSVRQGGLGQDRTPNSLGLATERYVSGMRSQTGVCVGGCLTDGGCQNAAQCLWDTRDWNSPPYPCKAACEADTPKYAIDPPSSFRGRRV